MLPYNLESRTRVCVGTCMNKHITGSGQGFCPIGRWVVVSCSTPLVHMCQSVSNITDIVLSDKASPWGQVKVCW